MSSSSVGSNGSSNGSSDEEHEDPSLSSASLAIQFELLGKTFHPVFTHQAFPGEHIRGYHPPLKRILELRQANGNDDEAIDEDALLHSSHRHHETASKELSIRVQLAPSCQVSHLELDTEQKRLPRRQFTRHAAAANNNKRRRLNSDEAEEETKKSPTDVKAVDEEDEVAESDADQENESENEEDAWQEGEDDDDEDNDPDSDFVEDEGNVSEVEDEQEVKKEGNTRGARMPTKEIIQSMKKGLPTVQQPNKKKLQEGFLRRPVGVELKEYTTQDDKTFVLSLANGSQATANYHAQVQRLALWFIETADDVNVASQEGGYWKVLYLFQKHKRTQYSLAGFVTLFHFHAPFKKPQPGIVVRVCQALVLPPYQRAGHGKRLLTCVVDIAHGHYADVITCSTTKDDDDSTTEIVEITVESPAPAFVKLRNRTDLDCFLRSLPTADEKTNDDCTPQQQQQPWIPPELYNQPVTHADFFTALSESQLAQAAATAKLIPRQVQIVLELYKLQQLQQYLALSTNNHKDQLEKRFRLMVKKRLNREHREDLSGFRTKAEKQAFLEDEFQICLANYQEILGPAVRTATKE